MVTNELGEAMKNYHVEVLSKSGSLPDRTGQVGDCLGALGPRHLGHTDTLGTSTWRISSEGPQAARAAPGVVGPGALAAETGELGLGPRAQIHAGPQSPALRCGHRPYT